jgi:hypothetical protein
VGSPAMPLLVRASNRNQPDEEPISVLEVEAARRFYFAKSVPVDVRGNVW